MADTAHTSTAQDSPAFRQIRLFLSRTFRDFMVERDLLEASLPIAAPQRDPVPVLNDRELSGTLKPEVDEAERV